MKKQVSTFLLTAGTIAVASAQGLKSMNMSAVTTDVKDAGKSMMQIIDMAIMIGLGLALISVVYMVATKNQHAKEWVVGFVVAIIVYLLFFHLLEF